MKITHEGDTISLEITGNSPEAVAMALAYLRADALVRSPQVGEMQAWGAYKEITAAQRAWCAAHHRPDDFNMEGYLLALADRLQIMEAGHAVA